MIPHNTARAYGFPATSRCKPSLLLFSGWSQSITPFLAGADDGDVGDDDDGGDDGDGDDDDDDDADDAGRDGYDDDS